MNAFPNGTRVMFWDSKGAHRQGTVQGSAMLPNGAQVVDVKIDGSSDIVRLPTTGLNRIQ